jgi:hypothetical protein
VFALALVALVTRSEAALGIDVSIFECPKLALSDWQCMANNGKSFAIIEVWNGGYQWDSSSADCVANAWAAGFAHVDVYAFLCPNCGGNNPCSSAMNQIVSNLRGQGINFGQLWIDVEQCDGCWNDADSNVAYIKDCVSTAQSLGVTVGIYSSYYEWQQTVGGQGGFSDLQLWVCIPRLWGVVCVGRWLTLLVVQYAHYDGNANFSDSWAYQFGGWAQPAMKQCALVFYNRSSCISDTLAQVLRFVGCVFHDRGRELVPRFVTRAAVS